jgi:TetR/AcrR family transcriptional repressor of lmrAB and yxaGH operons
MSKGEQTKTRLVTKTADLIAEQGYHATGLNQITQESGAPIGSLYYHFRGGKDQLVVAAMQAGGDAIEAALNAAFASTNDPVLALRTVIGLLGAQLEASAYTHGCPIATVTLEAAARNDTIQAVAQSVYRGWQAQIADYLVRVGVSEPQASSIALFSLTVIEGGLLLSRAERSLTPLQHAGEQLIRYINDQIGQAHD